MEDADRCILDHFARIRARTIELVAAAPEELLGRTPEGEEMSLHWQFVHIASGPEWWLTNVLRDGGTCGWPPPYAANKACLVQGLAASRDRLVGFFEADDGQRMAQVFTRAEGDGSVSEWTGRDRVLYLTDHDLHHRGRIVLALMQWGFDDLPGDECLWPAMAD